MNDLSGGADDRPVTVGGLVSALWRHRVLVALITIAITAAAIVVALIQTPVFTASVTIMPQQTSSLDPGILGRLSLLEGIMPTAGNNEEIYGEIVRSDQVLDRIIDRSWPTLSAGDSTTLAAFFGLDATGPSWRPELKRSLRRQIIAFSRERLSGFMRLQASVPRDPVLAAALANAVVKELESYNSQYRSTKAATQRAFIGGRLDEVVEDLGVAETALTDFVSQNRSYQSSPELLLEYQRLAREVEAQSSLWVELRRQYEVARIDEQKNSLVIDVLDYAVAPDKRSWPNRKLFAVTGFFLGAMLSLLIVLIRSRLGTEVN